MSAGPVTVYVWRFGPVFTERERRRLGMAGHHAGCWINSYWCGAEDCPMAEHDGKPTVRQPGGGA